jgi:hypothetical protein
MITDIYSIKDNSYTIIWHYIQYLFGGLIHTSNKVIWEKTSL